MELGADDTMHIFDNALLSLDDDWPNHRQRPKSAAQLFNAKLLIRRGDKMVDAQSSGLCIPAMYVKRKLGTSLPAHAQLIGFLVLQ